MEDYFHCVTAGHLCPPLGRKPVCETPSMLCYYLELIWMKSHGAELHIGCRLEEKDVLRNGGEKDNLA